MSDDEKVPGPEATPEEKRVIVAHDCAMEILSLPEKDRKGVLLAITMLVDEGQLEAVVAARAG